MPTVCDNAFVDISSAGSSSFPVISVQAPTNSLIAVRDLNGPRVGLMAVALPVICGLKNNVSPITKIHLGELAPRLFPLMMCLSFSCAFFLSHIDTDVSLVVLVRSDTIASKSASYNENTRHLLVSQRRGKIMTSDHRVAGSSPAGCNERANLL